MVVHVKSAMVYNKRKKLCQVGRMNYTDNKHGSIRFVVDMTYISMTCSNSMKDVRDNISKRVYC
jgi:hypothetical protein